MATKGYSNLDNAERSGGGSGAGAFSDENVRRGFIRKVFGLLTVQLLVTMGVMAIFFYQPVRFFVWRRQWIFVLALIATLASMMVLVCCGDLRRKTPHNLVFLGVFTLAQGVMLGTVTIVYSANEVLLAVGIVAAVSLALVVFALQTKIDFTAYAGVLYVGVVVLILFGFFVFLFPSRVGRIGYASLGAFIFAAYIVVDIQLMLGGKHNYALDPEEYVVATLNIYLDIINLFLMILSCLGIARN